MYRNLSPGAIGVDRGALDIFAAAKEAGFEGLDPDLGALADGQTPEEFLQPYRQHGLRVGGWGLPVPLLAPDDDFQKGLGNLARLAPLAASVGADRCSTWILPYSDTRPFEENFAFHIERLKPCAEILSDHGCRLGLEFIGPRTFREGKLHEFICTMDGMLDLAGAIGTGNVGLLLDAWHWYTSHGAIDDLLRLSDSDIVQVHINDAPSGLDVDQQTDSVRALPGETGVIDLAGFLGALRQIGYIGPVTPEPFSEKLKTVGPAEAVLETGRALRGVWV